MHQEKKNQITIYYYLLFILLKFWNFFKFWWNILIYIVKLWVKHTSNNTLPIADGFTHCFRSGWNICPSWHLSIWIVLFLSHIMYSVVHKLLGWGCSPLENPTQVGRRSRQGVQLVEFDLQRFCLYSPGKKRIIIKSNQPWSKQIYDFMLIHTRCHWFMFSRTLHGIKWLALFCSCREKLRVSAFLNL